jgi:hypothetical protein
MRSALLSLSAATFLAGFGLLGVALHDIVTDGKMPAPQFSALVLGGLVLTHAAVVPSALAD